ncbi:hypothetical protein Q3G72_013539 [Acer saccharum]|nr:hypothetical protein Q3G72_013539 [Acer saccharum]
MELSQICLRSSDSFICHTKKVIKVLQLRHLLNMEQHHTGDNMVSLMDAWLLYVATALLIKFVAIPTALLIKFVAIPTALLIKFVAIPTVLG